MTRLGREYQNILKAGDQQRHLSVWYPINEVTLLSKWCVPLSPQAEIHLFPFGNMLPI